MVRLRCDLFIELDAMGILMLPALSVAIEIVGANTDSRSD